MKRRQFISSTMASATLAAVPGFVSAKADMFEGETLRLGFIGTGRQGQKHIRFNYGQPGLEIHTLCDILPFHLDQAMGLVGPATKAVTDYRYMLDDPNIDAVVIATPFHFHAKPMQDALDAGKHVYVEKTLVKGHDQIAEVRKAVANTDRIIQTGYQHRYSDHLQHIAGLIQSGAIGTISKVNCTWNRNSDWRRPVPSPEFERAINWRLYREYSGGLTAELSSHQMDIIQWLMGSPPRQIMGTGGIDHWKDGRTTRDNIHLIVNHENGVVVSYECMTTNAYEGSRMTFLGTEGTIVTSLDEAWISSDTWESEGPGEESGKRPWGTGIPDDVDAVTGATMALTGFKGKRIKLADFNPTRNAMAAFRKAVISNSKPAASVENGLATARTVQLSLDAMDKGSVETY